MVEQETKVTQISTKSNFWPKADPGLVLRAQSGDQEAMETFLDNHYPLILRCSQKRLGNPQDAEDATQRICWKIAQGLPKTRPNTAVSPWLNRVVNNHLTDEARRRARNREETLNQAQWEDISMGSSFGDPAVLVEKADGYQALVKAINDLSEKQRTVLGLRCRELSNQDIGKVVGTTEGAVKALLHRAREKLRNPSAVND